jgi:prolyl-tRNA synthetase
VQSYKDLPLSVYQIHWKYRDELRAKSGILRGREFYMKDMYSFHQTQAEFDSFYETVKEAYKKIFGRMRLTAKVTEASGGAFSKKISYEFMILTNAGEDDIFYCDSCDYCINKEIKSEETGLECPKCGQSTLKQAKAAEAGNVFDLGKKYGKDFGFSFTDQAGHRQIPVMGCYGIGISRAMGILVETFHDDRGIMWPEAVAPYQVHLIEVGSQKLEVRSQTEDVYNRLEAAGVEVLWDDRNESPGVKFADADLIGIPVRLVVSERNGGQIEWKRRDQEKSELISLDEMVLRICKK